SGTARTGTAESGTARTGTAAAAAPAAAGAAQATAGRSRWRELAAASPLDASLLQVHVHGELHRLGHTVTGPLSAAVAQHYDDLGPAWDSQPVQRRATALAHLIATGTNPFPASRWQELTAHDPDRASRLRVLAAVELHRAQHPGMSRKTETFAHAYDHLADHWHTQPLADQATALAHKILTGTDLPLGTAPGAPGRTRAADDRDAADRLERTVRAELAALGHPAHDLPPAPKLVRDYPLDPAWHTMSPGHQAEAVARWIHTGLPPGPPTQTPTAPTRPATAPTPTPPATQTPTRTPTPAPGSTPPATETPTRTGTAGSPGTAPAHQDDRFLIEEVRREFRYLAPHPTKDLPTADAIREADRNLPKQPWPVTQRERGQHLAQILLTGEKTRLLGGADNTTTRPPRHLHTAGTPGQTTSTTPDNEPLQAVFRSLPPDIRETVTQDEAWTTYLTYQAQADAQTRPDDPSAPDTARRTAIDRTIAVLTARHRPQTHTLTAMLDTPHPPAHPPAEPQNPHHPHPPHTPPAPHTTTSPEPDPTTTSDTPLPDRPTQPPPPPALDEFTRPLSGLPADFLALLDWPTGETEPSTRTPPAHPPAHPPAEPQNPHHPHPPHTPPAPHTTTSPEPDPTTTSDTPLPDRPTQPPPPPALDEFTRPLSGLPADFLALLDWPTGETEPSTRTPPAHPQPTTTTRDPGDNEGFLAYGRTGQDVADVADVADSRTGWTGWTGQDVADVADSRTGWTGWTGWTGQDVADGWTGWTGGDVADGPDETGDRMPAGMADQWGPPPDPGTEQTPPKVPHYVSDQAATRHLTVYPVPADGDCFFHALIAARDMQAPDGPPANTTDVRAALAETLQQQLRLHPQHPHLAPWMPAARTQVLTALADHAAHQAGHTQGTDAFTQYTNEFSQAHAETRPDQQDWQHVITSLLTPGQWDTVAGDLAPALAAHHYNIRLHTLHIHPGHPPWTLTFGPENAPEHHLVRTTGNGPEHWMPAHPTTTTPALTPAPAPALTPTPTPTPTPAPALADATAPHDNQPATHPTPPHTTTNTAHTTTHHKTRKHARPTRTPRQGPHTKTDPTFDQYMQALEQWRKEAPAGQDRSRLLPPQSTSVPLRGPGAEVVHVRIGDWLSNLQHKGRDLAEGEAARLRNLDWTLVEQGPGKDPGTTRYKLKPTPDQREQKNAWTFEQYMQALQNWLSKNPTKPDDNLPIPPYDTFVSLLGPGAEVLHVPIGKWLADLQHKGRDLTGEQAAKLRNLGYNLVEQRPGKNTGTTRYKLQPVQGQRQRTRRPFEQYLLALDTWRAAPRNHSTDIPPFRASAHVQGADGRKRSVPIGHWLDHLRSRGLVQPGGSLLAGALKARGIPTKEENGLLRRTDEAGPVVPVWGVEVYLRGLATWRAAAPAGEDRSTAIPPDGTYITLTDPTPTPLTDASNTRPGTQRHGQRHHQRCRHPHRHMAVPGPPSGTDRTDGPRDHPTAGRRPARRGTPPRRHNPAHTSVLEPPRNNNPHPHNQPPPHRHQPPTRHTPTPHPPHPPHHNHNTRTPQPEKATANRRHTDR
ncbi:hypothetical protein OHB41_51840, partial [Streptomyces sp. NBC_01571]|nr:hypothetical protein [Streptomyces sp. NBC_01571]